MQMTAGTVLDSPPGGESSTVPAVKFLLADERIRAPVWPSAGGGSAGVHRGAVNAVRTAVTRARTRTSSGQSLGASSV